MARMRLQKEAMEYIQSKDPNTAITPHALRKLLVSGVLPCVAVGRRRLLNLDVLDDYLDHPERFTAPTETGKIRRIV